ncbi:helix-turn-helix domain-containing protein [Stackebrandtia soli]|uniref:helix-turn-helix domain-containing protein n=1 Tax=Stackebrandtia soli TaxID=1892856 RepID=UPI0039ED9009
MNTSASSTSIIRPRWLTVRQAATALGYSLSKTKGLVAQRRLRSIKDGGSRRILPEWIDEYIASVVADQHDDNFGMAA